jgi:hypothetical protein
MLELLPSELINSICDHLDIPSIVDLSSTSKEIRSKIDIQRLQQKLIKVSLYSFVVKIPMLSENSLDEEGYQTLSIKGMEPALKTGFIKIFNRKPTIHDIITLKCSKILTNIPEIIVRKNGVTIVCSEKPDTIRRTLWRFYYYIRDKLLRREKYSYLSDVFSREFPKKIKITSVEDLACRLFKVLLCFECNCACNPNHPMQSKHPIQTKNFLNFTRKSPEYIKEKTFFSRNFCGQNTDEIRKKK